MAGIIITTEFDSPGAGFVDYFDYVDRDDKKVNWHKGRDIEDSELTEAVHESLMYVSGYDGPANPGYTAFLDYMDRDSAKGDTAALPDPFTRHSDRLDGRQKEDLKGIIRKAEEDGSLLWKTVISFETAWLRETGLYSDRQRDVNDAKLIAYSRLAVERLIKEEGLDSSAVWWGEIHKNKEHYHIHFGIVDTAPSWTPGTGRCKVHKEDGYYEYKRGGKTRRDFFTAGELYQKGKFKASSHERAKSAFVHAAYETAETSKRLTGLARGGIVDAFKSLGLPAARKNKNFDIAFQNLIGRLPGNLSLWKYGMNAMAKYRDDIDGLSKIFIAENCAGEFEELEALLDRMAAAYEMTYGKGRAAYKKERVDGLYKRLGNTILKEAVRYVIAARNAEGIANDSPAETGAEALLDTDGFDVADSAVLAAGAGPSEDGFEYTDPPLMGIDTPVPPAIQAHTGTAPGIDIIAFYGKGGKDRKGQRGLAYRAALAMLKKKDEENYDPEEAVKIFGALSAEGHKWAQYRLGKIYLQGIHAEKDVDAGLKYLEDAQGQGVIYAVDLIGRTYLKGVDVEQDIPLAEDLLTEAAYYEKDAHPEEGLSRSPVPTAKYALAAMHLDGVTAEPNEDEAVKLLYEAADECDYEWAQYRLGRMLHRGIILEKSLTGAERYLRRASTPLKKPWHDETDEEPQGNRLAQYELARLYMSEDYAVLHGEENWDEAVHFLGLSAGQGYEWAQYRLGRMRFYGSHIDKDEELGIELLAQAADQRNAIIEYGLAKIYISEEYAGYFGEENWGEALRLIGLSAWQDYDQAECHLGEMLFYGIQMEQNVPLGMDLMITAAGKGNARIQYKLARLYMSEEYAESFGEENWHEALRLLELSAAQEYEWAQYRLGKMLVSGTHVGQDIQAGEKLFVKAAESGNAFLQYELAKFYLSEEYAAHFGKENGPEAVRLLERSAAQGYEWAEYRLGKMLLYGIHTEKDEDAGKDLLMRSIAQGNEFAAAALDWHENRARGPGGRHGYGRWPAPDPLDEAMNALKRYLRNDVDKERNMAEYERLQRKIAYDAGEEYDM
jgi:TPR repeat protein